MKIRTSSKLILGAACFLSAAAANAGSAFAFCRLNVPKPHPVTGVLLTGEYNRVQGAPAGYVGRATNLQDALNQHLSKPCRVEAYASLFSDNYGTKQNIRFSPGTIILP
jgi:hypothetical protein